MGGSASAAHNPINNLPPEIVTKKKVDEIVGFLLPLYYTKQPFAPGEKDLAEKSWKMILNNQCPHFNQLKKTHPEMSQDQSCFDHFFDVFYGRMFDVHPSCRGLFHKTINKQGSFFGRWISLLFSEMDEPQKFYTSLANLTHLHNKIGVKAFECKFSSFTSISSFLDNRFIDCFMGEVLIYALKEVLGPEAYTQSVHVGWVKFYSRMLDGIVPIVVEFELKNKDSAVSILDKRLSNVNVATPVLTSGRESSTHDSSMIRQPDRA